VAVIQIDETGLTAARIGDSSQLVVGDLAVAIGNPLGELGGTATAGIISALDRQVTIEGKAMSLLQTDASINPGNSGGGLFNQYGQLIGVVVAKSGGSNVEGLGFAIPINTAKAVADQLLEHGYVQGRVQMGLTLVDIATSYDATRYGVKALGVYVVSADTPQSKSAGFISGDRLISIDDAVINQFSDVPKALEKYEVGDTVKVTVAREDQTRVLTLVLGEKQS
jgi:serine protease Do